MSTKYAPAKRGRGRPPRDAPVKKKASKIEHTFWAVSVNNNVSGRYYEEEKDAVKCAEWIQKQRGGGFSPCARDVDDPGLEWYSRDTDVTISVIPIYPNATFKMRAAAVEEASCSAPSSPPPHINEIPEYHMPLCQILKGMVERFEETTSPSVIRASMKHVAEHYPDIRAPPPDIVDYKKCHFCKSLIHNGDSSCVECDCRIPKDTHPYFIKGNENMEVCARCGKKRDDVVGPPQSTCDHYFEHGACQYCNMIDKDYN